MDFFLYILECADGSLYIGHTDDLDRRMEQHDQGNGSSYTATRRPVKLIHTEAFETRYEALTMERKLKGWSRAKKLAYVAGDWGKVSALAKGKHRHQREGLGVSAGPSTSPAGAGYAQGERCGEHPAGAGRFQGERCSERPAGAGYAQGERDGECRHWNERDGDS